jgi:hypothetical protein
MMKTNARVRAEQMPKAIAKASAKAQARIKALILGGSISTLAVAFGVATTTEAIAPTRAEALIVQETKVEATLKKYENSHKLTDTELVELLYAVGFEGQDLKEAWAVAMTESTGNPHSHNGNRKTGDNSYGLFQINMIDKLGIARREKFGLESNAELLNPVINAQIAYHMSNGGKNWSAWKGMTPRTKDWLTKFPIDMKDRVKAKS